MPGPQRISVFGYSRERGGRGRFGRGRSGPSLVKIRGLGGKALKDLGRDGTWLLSEDPTVTV